MSSPRADGDPLLIHILDVGHGDSIVLEFPGAGDRFAIIDCHKHESSNRRGFQQTPRKSECEPKTLTFFRAKLDQGRRPVIEFACLTHPHADHYSGYCTLFDWFEKPEVKIPLHQFWGPWQGQKAVRAMRAFVEQQNSSVQDKEELTTLGKLYKWLSLPDVRARVRIQSLERDTRDLWNDSRQRISVDAIAPSVHYSNLYSSYLGITERKRIPDEILGTDRPLNDNIVSSAFLVNYGTFRAVLGGDVPNLIWIDTLPNGLADGCHVLKLSHHGSPEGNQPLDKPLCEHLNLTLCGSVINSGGYHENVKGDETCQALRKKGRRVFSTGTCDPEVVSGRVPRSVPPGTLPFWKKLVKEIPSKTLHGNITIRAFPDGRHEVETEFTYAR